MVVGNGLLSFDCANSGVRVIALWFFEVMNTVKVRTRHAGSSFKSTMGW